MPLKEVNWDEFVFRCHYFGELMTPTKGKNNMEKYNEAKDAHDRLADKLMSTDKTPSNTNLMKLSELDKKMKTLFPLREVPTLSGTAKRRLAQIYTEETTGRLKDIESAYLEKGLLTEEDSITKYSLLYQKMYRKNKERISNGFVIGEIDFDDAEQDMVIDTKSSWDIFSFDATVASGIKKLYWWQGQMYMWLKNRQNFRLAYCLNNTPQEIFQRLEKRLKYNFIGSSDQYEQAVENLKELHTYDDLPDERRIRVYDVVRDDDAIDLAKSYIPHFRNYLKNIPNTNKVEEYEPAD